MSIPWKSLFQHPVKDHPRLSVSERRVFQDVFAALADQRNTLMHMPAPEKPIITEAAIALLSLLHIVRRRTGLPTTEFFDPRWTLKTGH